MVSPAPKSDGRDKVLPSLFLKLNMHFETHRVILDTLVQKGREVRLLAIVDVYHSDFDPITNTWRLSNGKED
jgi:hypothetical protein